MAYSEKHPSGAKAHVDFAAFTAVRAKALTYQSCPVTKPLYTKNEIALLIRQENSGIYSHPFPQKTRKWMGHPDSI
jgi:hypothetical protein